MERSEVAYPFDLWILPFRSMEHGPLIPPLAHFMLRIPAREPLRYAALQRVLSRWTAHFCQHGTQHFEFWSSRWIDPLSMAWSSLILLGAAWANAKWSIVGLRNENTAVLPPPWPAPSYGHACVEVFVVNVRGDAVTQRCTINNAIGWTNKPIFLRRCIWPYDVCHSVQLLHRLLIHATWQNSTGISSIE